MNKDISDMSEQEEWKVLWDVWCRVEAKRSVAYNLEAHIYNKPAYKTLNEAVQTASDNLKKHYLKWKGKI